MIELYGMASPNVLKVVLMLEEVGLPYNFNHVNMIAGDQYSPDFLAINPNGKVPAIVDGDGPGGRPITVFESGAILMYLADKTGRFWPTDPRARHTVAQWLMFQMANVGPMSGQFVHFTRAAGPGNDYAVQRYTTETRRIYGVLDKRLAESRYLGGEDYSIADIATWPWGKRNEILKLRMEEHPNLARWVDEIQSRPAARATDAREAELRTGLDGNAFQAATPEQLDRFYIRGRYARS